MLQSNLEWAVSLDLCSDSVPTFLFSLAPNHLGQRTHFPYGTMGEGKKGCSWRRAAAKGSGQRRLEKEREIGGIKEVSCMQQIQKRRAGREERVSFSGEGIKQVWWKPCLQYFQKREKGAGSAMEKGSEQGDSTLSGLE